MTADHGNAEQMIDPGDRRSPHTAHTTNPVPFILVRGEGRARATAARLADVAPTLLGLQGLRGAGGDDGTGPAKSLTPRGRAARPPLALFRSRAFGNSRRTSARSSARCAGRRGSRRS